MNPLHAKILNRCREAVAKGYGYDKYSDVVADGDSKHIQIYCTEEAALLAMQEQAEFYRWAIAKGWKLRADDIWFRVDEPAGENAWITEITESELYEQWEREKTTTN